MLIFSRGLFSFARRSSATFSVRGRKKKVGVILFDRSRFVLVCTSLIFSLSFFLCCLFSAQSSLPLVPPPHPTLPLFYAAVDVEVPAVPPPPAAWPSVAEDVEVLPPPPATPAPEAAAPPPPLSGNGEPRPGRPEVTAAVTAAPFPAAPPPVFLVVICCVGDKREAFKKERERTKKSETSLGFDSTRF